MVLQNQRNEEDESGDGDRAVAESLVLQKFLQAYKPEENAETVGMLDDHYRIETSSPLPALDSFSAKAYAVSEQAGLMGNAYALVCTPHTHPRYDVIQWQKSIQHPTLCNVLAYGVVELANPAEERFVIVLEKPKGQTLAQLLAGNNGNPVSFQFIRDQVVNPVSAAISKMQESGLAHGGINLDSIYIGESTMLRECFSEAAGLTQKPSYESVERLQALAGGRDPYDAKADYYALAVVVLHILKKTSHLNNLQHGQLITNMLNEGVYNALLQEGEPPDQFVDLLKGIFSQSRQQRWNFDQIKAWVNGKRFNLLQPSRPSESGRVFEFKDKTCANRRALAQLMHDHWEDAITILRDGSLIRWIDMGLRNREVSEQMKVVIRSAQESASRSERSQNELIARTLIILDPEAPLRFRNIRVHVNGIGNLLLELTTQQNQADFQVLGELIEHELISVWRDLNSEVIEAESANSTTLMITRLDSLRFTLRQKGLGFGIERCLYDLVPNLACQSPLLQGYYCMTLDELLVALDKISVKSWRNVEPIDRHIAAFICSKLNMQREIRFEPLLDYPNLANSRSMVALVLFANAQQKCAFLQLPGLSAWVAHRLLSVVNELHGKTIRRNVMDKINKLAPNGYMQPILEVFSGNMVISDTNGFYLSSRQYQQNKIRLHDLNNKVRLQQDIDKLGFVMAKILTYLGFIVTMILLWSRE